MSDKKANKNTVVLERLKKLIDTTTREEIAKGLGCDTSMITKHYNGNREITVDFVVKYAKYFNVSTDYLLGLSAAKTNNKDIQFICDYTGLNEDSVLKLRRTKRHMDILLEDIEPKMDFSSEDYPFDFINHLLLNDIDIGTLFQQVHGYTRNIRQIDRLLDVLKEDIDNLTRTIDSLPNASVRYRKHKACEEKINHIELNLKCSQFLCVDAFEEVLSDFVFFEKEEIDERIEKYKEELNELSTHICKPKAEVPNGNDNQA